MTKLEKFKIGIIGLGYVGLPLAVEFGKKYITKGFDINKKRISELRSKKDSTLEIDKLQIEEAKKLSFTNQYQELSDCNIFIITVPTPIYKNKKPNMEFIKKASLMVASLIKKNDIVIYESTVYPGATEEFCVPLIQKKSQLKYNQDFFCGYSPERINPGDKKHRLTDIIKVTAGSNLRVSNIIDDLYKSIISAGTFQAKSIKVAEAAKVIENTQRDVNIALINELSIIFDYLKINTFDVLDAAQTKWNFLPFKPGLVGGHCIGVDPYYLTHKSKLEGYNPNIILSGRNINNNVAKVIFVRIKKLLLQKKIKAIKPKILIFGLTFKENCPDTRNSMIFKIVDLFKKENFKIDIKDPYIKMDKYKKNIKFSVINLPKKNYYDVILFAVSHDKFKNIKSKEILSYGKKKCVIFDVKNFLPQEIVDGTL